MMKQVAITRRKAGRFILATNELDEEVLPSESVLDDYKGQQAPERGFRILKDPLFFTSSVVSEEPTTHCSIGDDYGAVIDGLYPSATTTQKCSQASSADDSQPVEKAYGFPNDEMGIPELSGDSLAQG